VNFSAYELKSTIFHKPASDPGRFRAILENGPAKGKNRQVKKMKNLIRLNCNSFVTRIITLLRQTRHPDILGDSRKGKPATYGETDAR
jgi:hypothetical protein